jgi:hypothetical protein
MTKLAQFKPWFIEEPTAPGENSNCKHVYPINSFVR